MENNLHCVLNSFAHLIGPVFRKAGASEQEIQDSREEFVATLSNILLTGWNMLQEKELTREIVQSVVLVFHKVKFSIISLGHFLKILFIFSFHKLRCN